MKNRQHTLYALIISFFGLSNLLLIFLPLFFRQQLPFLLQKITLEAGILAGLWGSLQLAWISQGFRMWKNKMTRPLLIRLLVILSLVLLLLTVIVVWKWMGHYQQAILEYYEALSFSAEVFSEEIQTSEASVKLLVIIIRAGLLIWTLACISFYGWIGIRAKSLSQKLAPTGP